MSRRRGIKQDRRINLKTATSFIVLLFLILGLLTIGSYVNRQNYSYPGGLKPVEPPKTPIEQIADTLANNPITGGIVRSLGYEATPPPGQEGVGLGAEFGYTSTNGESVIFQQQFSGVGFVGMSGIYVKPSLGTYKKLKLFDTTSMREGEIWVKPIIKVRVFNGTPEEYSFKTDVKIMVDNQIIDEKSLVASGKGVPKPVIKMDKVSVKGNILHKILKGELVSMGKKSVKVTPSTSKKICFTADYQGALKFKGDEEPIVKEVKDIKLGCFDFSLYETGDFEMQVDKNVTVAPIMDVMTGGEMGMGGMKPKVTTVTQTVTIPFTTYVTTISGTAQTLTSYKTLTLTKTETKWMKTTITKKLTATVTKTVTVTAGGGGGGGSVLGNTSIITPNGVKSIDVIKPGDLVLTEKGFKPVKQVKVIRVDNLYRIILSDGKILLADDAQPVVTISGVKKVGELRIGNELKTLSGSSSIIKIERYNVKADVFDLVFDEPLNYYANGVLVNDALKFSGVALTWPYSQFVFIGG